MNVLLDTHAFIWFVEGDPQLSDHARSLIESRQGRKCISVASLFEMAIKMKIDKLPAAYSINQWFADAQKEGFSILPITEQHLTSYNQVPLLQNHRDPFDRMLIATAIAESLTIITLDPKFSLYGNLVSTAW